MTSASDIAKQLDTLPTLPTIVYELSQVINDPMSSTNDVEKLMANDQSLTSTVLRLVNSAYYSIPGGVSSLSRAIGYIGFDTVNQLVLSASILEALRIDGDTDFNLNEFWKHSIGVGIASETIAKKVDHPTPADLFTCGLVHDMGRIALCALAPESLLAVIAKCKTDHISFLEAETVLGVPLHTEVGQLLAKRWALPLTIQQAIRYHHTPELTQRVGVISEGNRNIDIVLLANLLVHALKFGNSGHQKIHGAPKEIMLRLGLDPERDLKPLLTDIKLHFDKAADFLRVLKGTAPGEAA